MNNLESITPPGFFGDSSKNIVYIKNFITDKELSIINNFVKENDKWKRLDSDIWDNRIATSDIVYSSNKKVFKISENIIDRLSLKIKNFFKVDVVGSPPAFVRWNVGNFQEPHADKQISSGPNTGDPNEFPWYDIGSMIYINDDYIGGEIYFPNQNVSIKPEAGAACFFPGDINYLHGVTEVKSGTRFTIPVFWTITKHI